MEIITKEKFVEDFQAFLLEKGFVSKISKQEAWELYKAVKEFEFSEATKAPVSLAGIGKFEIRVSKPRVTPLNKGKVDENAVVKRFKFTPSSKIKEILNG